MTQSTTFISFTKKADAQRVCKGLRGRNILAGVKASRGFNEVYGFTPERMTNGEVVALCHKIYAEQA